MGKINILITSGGTVEPIDSVRKITNMSTGKLGAMICDEFIRQVPEHRLGTVYYVCSRNAVRPKEHTSIRIVEIESVQSLLDAIKQIMSAAKIDYFVHAAAVSDFTVSGVTTRESMTKEISNAVLAALARGEISEEQLKEIINQTIDSNCIVDRQKKISSKQSGLMIQLVQTPKIISQIKQLQPETFLIGFKLLNNVEKSELFDVAFKLLRDNRCNLVLANDLADIRRGNHVGLIVYPEKNYTLVHEKEEIACKLVEIALKRGQTRYPKSVCLKETPYIPDETYSLFNSIGIKLLESGCLPQVESGTYGNMSVRTKDQFIITGRNVNKGNLTPGTLVKVLSVEDISSPDIYSNVFYEGAVKPSIDTTIHAKLYKLFGCKAILHVHTDKIFSGLPIAYNYACGTEKECNAIVNAFRMDIRRTHTVQIFKHGLITLGESLEECWEKLQDIFSKSVSIHEIRSKEDDEVFNKWLEHVDEVTGIETDLPYRQREYFYVISHEGMRKGILFLKERDDTSITFIIYLIPQYHNSGSGIGKQVLDIVTNYCIMAGKERMVLETNDDCGVIDYYTRKHGFLIKARKGKMTELEKFFLV